MSEHLFGRSGGGGLGGSLPTGVKLAAMALLAHRLMKHSRGSEAGAASASGGGLLGQGTGPAPRR